MVLNSVMLQAAMGIPFLFMFALIAIGVTYAVSVLFKWAYMATEAGTFLYYLLKLLYKISRFFFWATIVWLILLPIALMNAEFM